MESLRRQPRQPSAGPWSPLGRWYLWCGLGLVATILFGALAAAHAGDAGAWMAFDAGGGALAAAIATAACVARVRRERVASAMTTDRRRNRIGWSLVAAGSGAWAVGQLGRSAYEAGLGSSLPSPSVLAAAFLAFPALVAAGLLATLPIPTGRLSRARSFAEGLIIAAGMSLLSWSLIVGPALAKAGPSSSPAHALSLAHPALDAIALAAVLFVAVRLKDPMPGLGLLAMGVACVATSDSSSWYLSAIRPGAPMATQLSAGWVAGFLLIALAALSPSGRPMAISRVSTQRALLLAPAMPAALGALVALTHSLAGANLGPAGGLLTSGGLVVVLSTALLAIVSYENHALTRDLERRVRERTAELHATERYYRALVQHASDVVMAIDRDLKIGYLSDSAAEIFGYRPAELQGRELSAFGQTAARTLGEALRLAMLASEQITRVEWTLSDGSGRERHVESTITNLLADPDVQAIVLNTRDQTDRVALQDQLRHQAFHDPLTGLPNRALLADRAAQAFARSLRTGASLAVIAIDLDAFKLVNDNLGHQTGDRLLQEVAQRLQAAARPEDTVARMGGDEFLVLVDAIDSAEDAALVADRLRGSLRLPFTLGRNEHRITASIGVAVARASQNSFEELLSNADIAMYSIKASGKDALQLFQPNMHQQARERFRLQADLDRALERKEMWLCYQPEFDATGEQLQGFEALLRWNHPSCGLIRPERFIPLAEESGAIVPLGRWVLAEAMRQTAVWERMHPQVNPIGISVNVSPVQLRAPSLIADVRDALKRSQLDPSRVVLEITEQSLIEDSHTVTGALHELKQLGVRLAIDDFGTGYASLAYLQSMPVDILKIDQTFVRSSSEDERSRELLEAIIGIGRTLSLTTIAEGIERQSQLAIVQNIGCDFAQGYLLGRPLRVQDAQRLIAKQALPDAFSR
jgi:diguanylate cyclase (GGDEF)-like protein/PAS domain S-box-containing protein